MMVSEINSQDIVVHLNGINLHLNRALESIKNSDFSYAFRECREAKKAIAMLTHWVQLSDQTEAQESEIPTV